VGIAGPIGEHPRNAWCLMKRSSNYPANTGPGAKITQDILRKSDLWGTKWLWLFVNESIAYRITSKTWLLKSTLVSYSEVPWKEDTMGIKYSMFPLTGWSGAAHDIKPLDGSYLPNVI
jgi:hypothetical protein